MGAHTPQPGQPGTRRRRGSSGAAGPWNGVVDACAQAAARFSDPNAMEGVGALDTAGDAVEALAKSFDTVGKTVLDAVYIDPKVAPFFEELGRYLQAAVPTIRDGAASVRRAHQPDIDRVEEADPRKRRWDIAAHDK